MADASGIIPLGTEQASATESVRLKRQLDTLRNRLSGGSRDETQLKQACQDFEAVFVGKLWEEMRNTVPKEGYLHSKFEDHYVSLFDQEFSKKMAGAGGIGLGDMLYSQLKDKLQSASKDSAPGAGEALKPLRPEPGALKQLFPEPEPMPLAANDQGIALDPEVPEASEASLEQAETVAAVAPPASRPLAELPPRAVREAGLPFDPTRLGGAMLAREVEALAARIVEQGESEKAASKAGGASGREFAS